MIIEGQVHGGLTEALAIALGQEIAYDDMGNVKTGIADGFLHSNHVGNTQLRDRLTRQRQAHTIQSVPRALAKAPMWVASRHSQTRCMTLSVRLG